MNHSFADKPLKELKTGLDWIQAIHDYAYPGIDYDLDVLIRQIERDQASQMYDLRWKQCFIHLWPSWTEWVDEARNHLERLRYSDKSTNELLCTQPINQNYEEATDHHKFLLLKSVVQNPPPFLLELLAQDKVLAPLFPGQKTLRREYLNDKLLYYDIDKEGNLLIGEEKAKISKQHQDMLKLFDQNTWVSEDELIKQCCHGYSDYEQQRRALQQAISSFRNSIEEAAKRKGRLIDRGSIIKSSKNNDGVKGYQWLLVKT